MSSVSQSSVTLTSAAVEGLGQILSLPDALSSKDLETVCWCVVDLVLNSTDRKVRYIMIEYCRIYWPVLQYWRIDTVLLSRRFKFVKREFSFF